MAITFNQILHPTLCTTQCVPPPFPVLLSWPQTMRFPSLRAGRINSKLQRMTAFLAMYHPPSLFFLPSERVSRLLGSTKTEPQPSRSEGIAVSRAGRRRGKGDLKGNAISRDLKGNEGGPLKNPRDLQGVRAMRSLVLCILQPERHPLPAPPPPVRASGSRRLPASSPSSSSSPRRTTEPLRGSPLEQWAMPPAGSFSRSFLTSRGQTRQQASRTTRGCPRPTASPSPSCQPTAPSQVRVLLRRFKSGMPTSHGLVPPCMPRWLVNRLPK